MTDRKKIDPVTILFADLPDYLERHGLQIKPGSVRWERDPRHPQRERLVAELEPRPAEAEPEIDEQE